jgi:hypothetical protein
VHQSIQAGHHLAHRLGVVRLGALYFISDSTSLFFHSSSFQQILQNVQKLGNKCQMQEKNNKLTLAFEKIATVKKALEHLKLIADGIA